MKQLAEEELRTSLPFVAPKQTPFMLCACCLQGVQLTEKERRDLEYKEQVYRLAVERKKQLGE